MRYGFGIDLGGTTVKIAFFAENGEMRAKWEIPTVKDNEGRQILPDIADAILKYLEEQQISREDVLGIGIGVPGPVDGKGVVNKCINLGWGVFNLKKTMNALLHMCATSAYRCTRPQRPRTVPYSLPTRWRD